MGFDLGTIVIGILIFLSRIIDVTLGTMRTISIVQGKMKSAFFLGFFEVSMWLIVISTVINQVTNKPVLGIFYAFGFATGNVIGILLERKLVSGNVVIRTITSLIKGEEMAQKIRKLGHAVTTFQGNGMSGPVLELYIVCNRKNVMGIITLVKEIEHDAFYIVQQAGNVSRLYRTAITPPTGWRAILKKK
ncbi:MAG: DUF2179 domain-containing protein [bacterium]